MLSVRVEHEYWSSLSGPAWSWWVLAILPLDPMAQVGFCSSPVQKIRGGGINMIRVKRKGAKNVNDQGMKGKIKENRYQCGEIYIYIGTQLEAIKATG